MRLKELKNWSKDCNYADSVIDQSFYNAKLQRPAPFTDNLKNIPFVTTYCKNIDNEKVVRKICAKLSNIQSRHLLEEFKNKCYSLTKANQKLAPVIKTSKIKYRN